MDFRLQVISTFIGAAAGFIFSLALFYVSETLKFRKVNRDLRENLQKEFEYNLSFLENYKKEYEELLRKVSTSDPDAYIIFKFDKLQRLFLLEAFNRGLLYKHLSTDEISELDAMLFYFTDSTNSIVWNRLNDFRSGSIEARAALRSFEYDKSQIERYEKVVKNLKVKLKNLK